MIDLNTVGNFCWFWSDKFFIETTEGNFVWSDPDYDGDNTIRPFEGGYKEFCQAMRVQFGRDKGTHRIGSYCGNEIKILNEPFEA